MAFYQFKVILNGTGDTPDEAWRDAIEGFIMDPGVTPSPEDYTVEEEEG